MKKIFLSLSSLPLTTALREHLSGFEVSQSPEDGPFDLIVGETSGIEGACPVLKIDVDAERLRLGSILRRMGQMLEAPVLYMEDIVLQGEWIFRPQDRQIQTPQGETLDLTDRETDLLAYLARAPYSLFTRDDLLREVWDYKEGVDTHTLETHIHRLRRKIGDDLLITETGGYRLCRAQSKEGAE